MKLFLDWLICVRLNTHSWFLQMKHFLLRKKKRKKLEHDLPELFCVHLKIHGKHHRNAKYRRVRLSTDGRTHTSEIVRQSCYVLCSMLVRCSQGDADPSHWNAFAFGPKHCCHANTITGVPLGGLYACAVACLCVCLCVSVVFGVWWISETIRQNEFVYLVMKRTRNETSSEQQQQNHWCRIALVFTCSLRAFYRTKCSIFNFFFCFFSRTYSRI